MVYHFEIATRCPPSQSLTQQTAALKPAEVSRRCYETDATNVVRGRLASFLTDRVGRKHAPRFLSNVDRDDSIVVMEKAVERIMPQGSLAREQLRNLDIYNGPYHRRAGRRRQGWILLG